MARRGVFIAPRACILRNVEYREICRPEPAEKGFEGGMEWRRVEGEQGHGGVAWSGV